MRRIVKIFSFAGRDDLPTFARYAAGFAIYFGGLWALGSSGVLPETIARGQEPLIIGIVIAAVPFVATLLRRLNDTVFPGGLIIAAPTALGLSYFLPVVAGLGWAEPVFFWLSIVLFVALAVGLVWPSRPVIEQGVDRHGGQYAV